MTESDRDAYIDLLYSMYDEDMVDLCIEILGENELLDGVPDMLEDYYNNYYNYQLQQSGIRTTVRTLCL